MSGTSKIDAGSKKTQKMKNTFFLSLITLFIMSSCVSKKEFTSLENRHKKTQDLLNTATVKLNACLEEKTTSETLANAYKDQLSDLKRRNDQLFVQSQDYLELTAKGAENLEKTFKEDIKKRIDETSKYIRPSEKTTDYAYMFIPADGLYQDLLNSRVGTLKINSKDLVSYAYSKKVMIVSPMSLFPMLQITVKALHNMKVERSIDDIQRNIGKLSNHLNAYKDSHDSLGKTIRTVVNHFNKSSKEFNKIDKDIIKISSGKNSIGFEEDILDTPQLDE